MMMKDKSCIDRLIEAGISRDDAMALRRIAMTLRRWHELECGDGNDYQSWAIERDDKTDKPYMVYHPHDGKSHREPIADREDGAIKRLTAIMARYPGFEAYVQTDSRGVALYILRPGQLADGAKIDECYSRGIAVYK